MDVALIDSMSMYSAIKIYILLALNILLTVLLYYSAVGFSAYWINFRGIMEVSLVIVFAFDFIIFDVVLSFILAVFWKCKFNCLFSFFNLFKVGRTL